MEILKHLARTVAQVLLLAGLFISIIVGTIWLKLPAITIPIALVVLIGGYIYGSARWHPYWAPVSKIVAQHKWISDNGEEMRTLVENAIVQSSAAVKSVTLRVSTYGADGTRMYRVLVGDDAVYLGLHGIGLWFFINDRFHARRDGLLCLDLQDGSWIYHRPQSDIHFVSKKKDGLITVELPDGEETDIQLAHEERTG